MKVKGYKHKDRPGKGTSRAFKKIFRMLLFGAIAIGFGYVFQTNTIVAQGYEISSLNKQMNDLTSQNQTLKTQISSATSFSNLNDTIKSLNLAPATNIFYLTAQSDNGSTLAQETRPVF